MALTIYLNLAIRFNIIALSDVHHCPEGDIKRRKKVEQSLRYLLMQNQNLFLNGNDKNINALVFDSSDINLLVSFLQQNKQMLSHMNAQAGQVARSSQDSVMIVETHRDYGEVLPRVSMSLDTKFVEDKFVRNSFVPEASVFVEELNTRSSDRNTMPSVGTASPEKQKEFIQDCLQVLEQDSSQDSSKTRPRSIRSRATSSTPTMYLAVGANYAAASSDFRCILPAPKVQPAQWHPSSCNLIVHRALRCNMADD